MKHLILWLLSAAVCFYACSSDSVLTQEEEAQALSELWAELQVIATSEACTGDDNVAFTAIGSKACGGPAGYLAYSLSINVEEFLARVEAYTNMERAFNTKWAVISDCAVENPPTDVFCDNGVPKLSS